MHNLPPEFNDTKHVKGIVSMARGDAPDSAQTSFFICTGTSTALDGVYTAFGRVVDGMAAVDAIEATPRTGETPNARIELRDGQGREKTLAAGAEGLLSRMREGGLRGPTSSNRYDPRHPTAWPTRILDLNAIAGFEVAADDRLRPDPRDRDLPVGIVDVGEEDVPGHLPVDAHGLDLLQDAVAGAFEHDASTTLERKEERPRRIELRNQTRLIRLDELHEQIRRQPFFVFGEQRAAHPFDDGLSARQDMRIDDQAHLWIGESEPKQ